MKKYLLGSLLIIAILITIIGCNYNKPKIEKEEEVLDGISFKTEFENVPNERYHLVIEKENPFKYLTVDNMDEVFKTTNIIILGYPTSDVTRAVVEQLIKISKELNLENIYYYNILDNRTIYTINETQDEQNNEKIEIVKEKEKTTSFEKLSTYISSYFKSQQILYKDKIYTPEEKTVIVPVVILIKDGKIIKYYDKFDQKEQDDFTSLTEEDYQKLKDSITAIIE